MLAAGQQMGHMGTAPMYGGVSLSGSPPTIDTGAPAAGGVGMPMSPSAMQPSGLVQPLTMVAPASAFAGESARYPWYRVAFVGGVDLRQGPSVEAPRTGETLCQNATFAAAEELLGADGRVYLRLADGRGWAFDDSALFPLDPAVIRGFWHPVSPAPPRDGSHAPGQAIAQVRNQISEFPGFTIGAVA